MHSDFAAWYRIAGITPQSMNLDKRWEAIERFVKKADNPGALEVIRLFFAKPPKDAKFLTNYLGVFQETDPAFDTRNNTLEMEILAGSTIAHLLEHGNTTEADTAALATVCADFQGLHPPVKVPEIVDIAYSYLHRRSDSLRSSTAATKFQVSEPNITEAINNIKKYLPADDAAPNTQVNINYIVGEVPQILIDLNSSIVQLVNAINSVSEKSTRDLLLQQEETDILWWLFAEYSNDRRMKMADVGHPAAIMVTGKELGDLTSTLPGPVAAEAFIVKMLQTATKNKKHKEITVREAIGTSPKDWREQWMKGKSTASVDDLCPVHFAVERSLETDDPDEWASAFERRSGVKATVALSPVKLAMQVYQESLLLKALG